MEGENRGEVFLYNKAHLRANAAPPEPETLKPIAVNGVRLSLRRTAISLLALGHVGVSSCAWCKLRLE